MSDYDYKVPRKMRDKYDAITERTDEVCDEHLTDGYADLAREMTAALSRRRSAHCPGARAASGSGRRSSRGRGWRTRR